MFDMRFYEIFKGEIGTLLKNEKKENSGLRSRR